MMKKLLSGLLLLLLTCPPFSARQVCAGPTQAETLLTDPDNPHNLSNWATHTGPKAALVDGTDQICIFCHTPHGADASGPLWNRSAPAAASFPLYGQNLAIKDSYGAGIQASVKYGPTYGVYPNGSSRLCMSCHDGVTAIGAGLLRDGSDIVMTGTALDPDGSLQTGRSSIINLATSHPISFIYDDTTAAQIEGAYDNQFGPGSYFEIPTNFDPAVRVYLDGLSRMQCTTCHDPHYANHLAASNPTAAPFWGNTYSTGYTDEFQAVCDQCHLGTPTGTPPMHLLP